MWAVIAAQAQVNFAMRMARTENGRVLLAKWAQERKEAAEKARQAALDAETPIDRMSAACRRNCGSK